MLGTNADDLGCVMYPVTWSRSSSALRQSIVTCPHGTAVGTIRSLVRIIASIYQPLIITHVINSGYVVSKTLPWQLQRAR